MATYDANTAILVLCKAPIAGQVKTRLMPQLSAEQASTIHQELTHRTLSLLTSSALFPVQLWCSPDTQHDFFSECERSYAVSLHQQHGKDLGERMHHAISTALKSSTRVILIGCDCPSLTVEDFTVAIKALQHADDVVISPAEDGGYALIGMTAPHPELFFNMVWGQSNVYKISCDRIDKAGLKLIEMKRQWDVDCIADFERYNAL